MKKPWSEPAISAHGSCASLYCMSRRVGNDITVVRRSAENSLSAVSLGVVPSWNNLSWAQVSDHSKGAERTLTGTLPCLSSLLLTSNDLSHGPSDDRTIRPRPRTSKKCGQGCPFPSLVLINLVVTEDRLEGQVKVMGDGSSSTFPNIVHVNGVNKRERDAETAIPCCGVTIKGPRALFAQLLYMLQRVTDDSDTAKGGNTADRT